MAKTLSYNPCQRFKNAPPKAYVRTLRDLKASLDRMEERAVAAEKRAEAAEKNAAREAEARANAEKRIEELTKTIDSLLDASKLLPHEHGSQR